MKLHLKSQSRLAKNIFAVLLLVGFILSSLSAVFALRSNNLTMLDLKGLVYKADTDGKDTNKPLESLRSYVNTHMHTDLSAGNETVKLPVQLTESYRRAKEAEIKRVSVVNTQVGLDAQSYCERTVPNGLSGRGRVPCIEEYKASHGVKEAAISEDLYKFNFSSPVWSSDIAGWSIVFSAIFGVLLVVTQLFGRILYSSLLRRRY